MPPHTNYAQLIHILAELGISDDIIAAKQLPFHAEAGEVVVAETDVRGRAHYMTPAAAQAWYSMKQAAAEDGITLELVSAFRNIEQQAEIIRDKLARGLSMKKILTLSAAPGYSEHHSGCAIDINTPGCIPTEEEFEATTAFAWLLLHAKRFDFSLSYPRNNALGFIYEPWHWLYRPTLPLSEILAI